MARRTVLTGAGVAALAAVGVTPAEGASAPFIFYTPHQDDETIFAGQIIAHQVQLGRRVIIVCATDGSINSVIWELTGKAPSKWWGGYHDPTREQIGVMSYPDIGKARDRELVAAAGCLGVAPGDIRLDVATRVVSAGQGRPVGITVAQAESLIKRYASTYPGATHCTMWWGDGHVDHANLGQGLRNLARGGLKGCQWAVKAGQRGDAKAVAFAASDAAKLRAKHAAWAYRSWAPAQGLYAIGYHSSASYFAEVERGDVNWIVTKA
jgi:LmbE family N-acetylglucosaminyl deacetylase